MRLKSLEVQGYKSFATKTQFSFEPGITAIVGPNGSGKSNVADAVRWALGEQSYRLLRGKRTEDMIFSGSAQRARLGMAQVFLTLDNTDGDLPIDFSEVTLGRRAFRSGENEYLLNGNRVRLRDIAELLARSGLARRSYSVVGQGLVDSALALRPQERRELFEEAAGIAHYQARRAEALNRLEETRANLVRINDIINEIAPRLRRLERESERARHHLLLTRQLEGLLRTWYGYRWRQEQVNLLRAEDALARREQALARRREDMAALDTRSEALRSRQTELRTALSDWHRQAGRLRAEADAVQRDLAVAQERQRQQARQRDGLLADLATLRSEQEVIQERIVRTKAEIDERRARAQQRVARVRQAEAALREHEQERDGLVQSLADLRARSVDLASRMAEQESQLSGLEERRGDAIREASEHRTATQELEASLSERQREVETAEAQARRIAEQVEALSTRAQKVEREIERAQSRQADLREAVHSARQTEERLQTRLDTLQRMRDEGQGFSAGVRAILGAARGAARPQLRDVLGTVAELVHVPAELEVAISTALGHHLQDVVVGSWRAAGEGVEFLKRGQRGRATFLPLDTVRPSPRLEVPPSQGTAGADLLGLAADLVGFRESRLAPVIELLLGRTLVVRHLDAARRLFQELPSPFRIVTLGGELVQSSGAVTGGVAGDVVERNVLARERDLRELPETLRTARADREQAEAEFEAQRGAEQRFRAEMAALEARLREQRREYTAAQDRQASLVRQADRLQADLAWHQQRIRESESRLTALRAQEAGLRDKLDDDRQAAQSTEARMAALQAELDALRGEALYASLVDARTAAAVARSAWETRRQALEELHTRLQDLDAQLQTKQARVTELDGAAEELKARMQELADQEAALRARLAQVEAKIGPAEEELEHLDVERRQVMADEKVARAALREAETRNSQALLNASRQQDRVVRLREQIMDDFGLVEMERLDGVTDQPPLPLGELVQALPAVQALPEGLEDELHHLKAQLKRMGPVNPGAPAEYAEVLDRHLFLSNQAADLEEASRSLREVIAELDEVMRQAFDQTFQAVAAEFGQTFTRLFGGGSARLILTDPDDLDETGVEILARPPGKRQQGLALLSGGERALTAVALIFAILTVSTPPFAFLDEVDAMLDEANVGRFREALKELSERTQCVVITHNRGTIQAADTIYGVSMASDSTSQVVSLRLEGDRVVAANGEVVTLKDNG